MKFSRQAALAALLISLAVYLGTVEYRMGEGAAAHAEIENLKDLLVPLLVDFKADLLVEERLAERDIRAPLTPETMPGPVDPDPVVGGTGGGGLSALLSGPASADLHVAIEDAVESQARKDATDWATEAIQAPQKR